MGNVLSLSMAPRGVEEGVILLFIQIMGTKSRRLPDICLVDDVGRHQIF